MADEDQALNEGEGGSDARRDYLVVRYTDASLPEWTTLLGADLDQPISVKFKIAAGRIVVTGIMIDNDQPITSRALRAPRLAGIEAALLKSFREDKTMVARYRSKAEQALGHPDEEVRRLAALDLAQLEDWELRLEQATTAVTAKDESNTQAIRARGRGATPPTDEQYKAFADLYLQTFAERPRGAINRMAEKTHMHRITVGTWITECRKRGYLPPKEKK